MPLLQDYRLFLVNIVHAQSSSCVQYWVVAKEDLLVRQSMPFGQKFSTNYHKAHLLPLLVLYNSHTVITAPDHQPTYWNPKKGSTSIHYILC